MRLFQILIFCVVVINFQTSDAGMIGKLLGKPQPLNYTQISQLTGKAGLSFMPDYYTGDLYNGNNDITVTELTIKLTTTVAGSKKSRTYVTEVNIPPMTTRSFGFTILTGDKNADYSWSIIEAKGK